MYGVDMRSGGKFLPHPDAARAPCGCVSLSVTKAACNTMRRTAVVPVEAYGLLVMGRWAHSAHSTLLVSYLRSVLL